MQNPIQLAGCIILDDYGRLLLMHRYTGDGQWELPGGKIEPGESPAMAAMRELAEELGIEVAVTSSAGQVMFEQDEQAYNYTWLRTTIVSGQPQIMELETFDDVDYFEFEDLESLALSPNMLILQEKIAFGEVALEQ